MSDIAIRVDRCILSTVARYHVPTCQRSNDSVILSRVTEPTSGRAETFGGRVASLLDASRGLRLTK